MQSDVTFFVSQLSMICGISVVICDQSVEMDGEGCVGRISRDNNRKRYMERHFSILRMLPPGKNFWFGNTYSCTYIVLLTVMCLQTGCFP